MSEQPMRAQEQMGSTKKNQPQHAALDVWGVPCRSCGAEVGERCKTAISNIRRIAHSARYSAAAANGMPEDAT